MIADHLSSTFLRLRPDSSIERLPVDATFWPRLMSGELGDFHHEYLVTTHHFDADWDSWEQHPLGDEVVCLLAGSARLVLEDPEGAVREITFEGCGSFCVVPRGHWHTARIATTATLLFITAGEGTRHRPR